MHDPQTLPSRGPLLRIGNLHTLAGVREEMTRIYRASRRREIDSQDLTRFVFALQAIAKIITTSDLETRIGEMEQRLAAPGGTHDTDKPPTTH